MRGCALLVLLTASAVAEPRIPPSDDALLEQLPARVNAQAWSSLRAARAELASDPKSFAAAMRVARSNIDLVRMESDNRYLGYAEAAIAPWLAQPSPPPEALMLRATISQNRHDFESAVRDLRAALKIDPGNLQAQLTLSSILTTRGEFEEARAGCKKLLLSAPELVVVACLASADSMSGKLEESYSTLRELFERSDSGDVAVAHWIIGLLAEMAERMGKPGEAEDLYRAAAARGRLDSFMRTSFADFLLERGRPAEALQVLEDGAENEVALLRRSLAHKALGNSAELAREVASMNGLLARSGLAGDRIHLREEGYFRLRVLGDAEAALAAARHDWEVHRQREAPDVRLMIEASLAARDAASGRAILAWIERTGFQDARNTASMGELQRVLEGR